MQATKIKDLPRAKTYHKRALYMCGCGSTFEALSTRVDNNYKTHCGCLTREKQSASHTKHGFSYKSEYHIWQSMKARCQNKNHEAYANYGGRGIKVCDRWASSFENFAIDMGKRPSAKHTLDRIDVDGEYSPANCEWKTMKEQQRNRRNTLFVKVDGAKVKLSEYAEFAGMTYSTAYMRLWRGQLTGVERLQ